MNRPHSPKISKVCLITQDLRPERQISNLSADHVGAALSQLGISFFSVPANPQSFPLDQIQASDLVFNLAYGQFGEDGVLSAILESLGYPYIGPSSTACLLTYDKRLTKLLLRHTGIQTPAQTTTPPFILKSPTGGSSDTVQLITATDMTHLNLYLMSEEFLPGREFCATAISINHQIKILPVVEIIKSKPVFTATQKYSPAQNHLDPHPEINRSLKEKINSICLRCFRLFKCRLFTKVDIILDATENPSVIEIDGIPGFGPNSIFPLAAKTAGLPFTELIQALVYESII